MVCVPFQRGHLMEGCVHVRVVDGKVKSIETHFEIPEGFTGVVHCKPEDMLTDEQFRETHPDDVWELEHFDQIWVGLWHRADGKHDIRSKMDVTSDHHYLDMLCQIMGVWKKCNH